MKGSWVGKECQSRMTFGDIGSICILQRDLYGTPYCSYLLVFSRVESTRRLQAIASIDTPTYMKHPTEILRSINLAEDHSSKLTQIMPTHLYLPKRRSTRAHPSNLSSQLARTPIKSLILIGNRDWVPRHTVIREESRSVSNHDGLMLGKLSCTLL